MNSGIPVSGMHYARWFHHASDASYVAPAWCRWFAGLGAYYASPNCWSIDSFSGSPLTGVSSEAWDATWPMNPVHSLPQRDTWPPANKIKLAMYIQVQVNTTDNSWFLLPCLFTTLYESQWIQNFLHVRRTASVHIFLCWPDDISVVD